MSLKDRVLGILKDNDNVVRDAAEAIYDGPREVVLYVLQIGLDRLKAVGRRNVRRELKRELAPTYVRGRVTGSIVFSPKTKKKIAESAQRLFDDWQIDANITLGNATREELLARAQSERRSAKGHIRTAQFYEAVAEPLKPGQRVREYWASKADVVKVKNRIWRDTEEARPALV